MDDRFDLVAALRPNVSVAVWARGRDAFAWHARIAALSAAALVLANVALSPDHLWSAWPLAVWAVLLLAHAGIVAWTVYAGARESVVDRPERRAVASASAPVFAADSPTVERPRVRPNPPAASVVPEVRPAPASAHSDGHRGRMPEDAVVAGAAPAAVPLGSPRDDVLVGVAAAHGLADSAPNGGERMTSIATADAAQGERQDVAVSVVVLAEGGAAPLPAAPTRPVLPERVVALWGVRPAGHAPAWPTPPADHPGAGAR